MSAKGILVLGKGFIGRRIQEFLGCAIAEQRIHSYKDVELILKKYKPTVIINATGFTGFKNVDGCEEDIDKTIVSNTFVPLLLGEAAYRHGFKLVHISSGCIYHFDYGQAALTENKSPDYYDLYYSRTKIYAEEALTALAERCNILTLRIRVPLDDRPHPKNILTKLLSFDAVIDIANSVTYIPDFLQALKHLIKIDARGIYNVVLKGGLRYPQLLKEFQRQRPDFKFKTMALKNLGLKRTNLILSIRKLEQTGFQVRTPAAIYKECVLRYLNDANKRK